MALQQGPALVGSNSAENRIKSCSALRQVHSGEAAARRRPPPPPFEGLPYAPSHVQGQAKVFTPY